MTRRVAIFGNSGSGKSTLARSLAATGGLTHLDLDTLAWLPTAPPTRRPLDESRADIDAFVARHESWVIEGCDADLLEFALGHATEVLFLDLPVARCQQNARRRPWEPHKYESKAAQDANLPMLLEWIAAYDRRTDEFSRGAHRRLFDGFAGDKRILTGNQGPG